MQWGRLGTQKGPRTRVRNRLEKEWGEGGRRWERQGACRDVGAEGWVGDLLESGETG